MRTDNSVTVVVTPLVALVAVAAVAAMWHCASELWDWANEPLPPSPKPEE